MKKNHLAIVLGLATLSASALALAQPEMSAKSQYPLAVEIVEEAGGGPVEATVKQINSATRHIGLELPNGKMVETTFSREVENLHNFNPGDKVIIDYVNQLLLYFERVEPGMKGVAQGAVKRRSPEEVGMPGGSYTYVLEAIGVVDKVDAAAGQLTLDLGGGRSHTYQAAEGVDVSPLKTGDTVKGVYAEQLSIKALSKNPLKPKF